VRLYQKSFTEIAETLCEEGEVAKAVLLDLGLSSFLLEDSGRGFTFQKEEPLDMRMSYSYAQLTAKEVLNRYDFLSLVRVFSYGEVPVAKKFAKFILERRKQRPFETTGDLVEAVREFFRPGRREKELLAVVFQALRIEVNQELRNLELALENIPQILRKGGRFLVISFHSLEDRLVKRAFKGDPRLKPLTRKPILPSEEEIRKNPRARSAKLRIAERV
jgi:16S rRNA (cytosine1402-N4)-methyltransferase